MIDCYVGIGGNFSNTLAAMKAAIQMLKESAAIQHLRASRLYKTSPVSSIKQPEYLNAVLRFETALSLQELWHKLKTIEYSLGKKTKAKEEPRLIDLDLLFYGSLISATSALKVPHPHWHERLFVLAPLADVTEEVPIGGVSIKERLAKFSNPHCETVRVIKQRFIDA